MSSTVGEIIAAFVPRVDQQAVNSVNAAINQISNTAKRLLGAIGIGFSLTQLNRMADEYSQIGDQLSYLADENTNIVELQSAIGDRAKEARMAYSQMVNYATKLTQSAADVFPLEEASQFVEYVVKLEKAAGKSDSEISRALNTLQRMIAVGKASEGDIDRMLRNNPELAEQLAKALDTDAQGLKTMAKQGKLTAETLKNAMKTSANEIDNAFGKTDKGISDAMQSIRDEFMRFVGEINQEYKITQNIAEFMEKAFDKALSYLQKLRNNVNWLAEKLGGVQNLVRLITFVVSALMVIMNWNKITTGLKTVLGLVKAIFSPLGLLMAVLLGLYLVIEDIVFFVQGKKSLLGEMFKRAGIDAEDMRRKILRILENVRIFFRHVWLSIKQIVQPILDSIRKRLEEVFGPDIFFFFFEGAAGIIDFLYKITDALRKDPEAAQRFADGLLKVAGAIISILAIIKVISAISKVSSAVKAVATVAGNSNSKIAGLASSILAVVVAIGLLVAIAKYLSTQGQEVWIILGALVGAVAILVAIMGALGPRIKEGGTGFLLLGAGLALCAGSMMLLVLAAQMLAANKDAQVWFAVMAVLLVALIAIIAAFSTEIAVAGIGVLAIGAGLTLAGVAALLAAAALAIIVALLPALIENGAQGAITILELAGALTAFGIGATAAGAGALLGIVGLTALWAILLLVDSAMRPLSGHMDTTARSIDTIADRASEAASGLKDFRDSSKDIKSNLQELSRALPDLNDPMSEFADLMRDVGPVVTDGFSTINEVVVVAIDGIVKILSPLHGRAKTFGMSIINNIISGIELRLHALGSEMQTVVSMLDLSGVLAGSYSLAYAGLPSAGTVGNVTNNSTSRKTIYQTNNFSNTFNGSDRENQRQSGAQMNINTDEAIDSLRRGMAGL